MSGWHAVEELSVRQHGVVTRGQCRTAGIPSRTLSQHVARYGWRTLFPGVFALPGTAYSFEQQAAAALLLVGGEVMLTGAAALRLADVVTERPGIVDLLLPSQRNVAVRRGITLTYTNAFAAAGRHHVRRLSTARTGRALADLAPRIEPTALGRLMARGCALRRCTLGELDGELDRRAWQGRQTYRAALAMVKGELTHSGAERSARRHLRGAGIIVHPRPYRVEAGGRVIGEIDIAMPELLYGIEIDGPHHDLPEQAAADKQRDRKLARLGWHIDRFPVELVDQHPEQFVREVQEALWLRGSGRDRARILGATP